MNRCWYSLPPQEFSRELGMVSADVLTESSDRFDFFRD